MEIQKGTIKYSVADIENVIGDIKQKLISRSTNDKFIFRQDSKKVKKIYIRIGRHIHLNLFQLFRKHL